MEGDNLVVVAAGVQLQLAVLDQVGRKLRDVHHLGGFGVLEFGAGDGDDRFFKKIGRPVHGVHVLVDHPPHVAALAAQDPFDPQALGLHVHFGIEPFHGLVGGEKAEVAAFRCIGAPGDIETRISP
jgi:hypothetical protein